MIGIWMTLGMCFGAAFGNPEIGISFGMVAGIIIGTSLSNFTKDNYDDEETPPK